jgi:dihydrofolate synthase/folylpolyglutamate synthase
MNFEEAMAFLNSRATYETTGRIDSPTTDRIRALMNAMGEPQRAYPVIHITGTNGKGSTTQMITRLLMARGLTVGTYTSPHLEHVTERLARNGEPIDRQDFADQIAAVADIETLVGVEPSYFETVTAAAFRWFADVAVDVAVVEVGLLGRWDATNVCDAQVAVITNIGIDHTEFAGPTKQHIAREKAGIITPGCAVLVGETAPEIVAIFADEAALVGATVLRRGDDFDVLDNQLALGGRQCDVRTPTSVYDSVFVPLHGRHQGENASLAIAAVETFFAAPVADDVLREGLAAVRMPGRFEVLGHQPLVIVDGAHNPLGADSCAQVFFEDFDPAGKRILVVGMLRGRDAAEMLSALRADEFDVVITCMPPSPRAMDGDELTAAAVQIGCDDVLQYATVEQGCDAALRLADADDAVLVTGSLYVIGAARPYLRKIL